MVCALTAFLILSIEPCIASTTDLDDYAKQYKRQKNELKKAEMFVDAIDSGLISFGGPVANVTKLIGRKEQYVGKVISFEHFLPDVGKGNHGWYFMFSVEDGVHLSDYGLTNNYATYALQPRSQPDCKPDVAVNKTASERERVLACIKSIQCRQIETGIPIADLPALLSVEKSQIVPGQSFTKVFFEPTEKASKGWYFAFSSEDGKTIKYYWISNVRDGMNFVAPQLAPRPVSIRKPKRIEPKPLLDK
jgi:hypothetical protein